MNAFAMLVVRYPAPRVDGHHPHALRVAALSELKPAVSAVPTTDATVTDFCGWEWNAGAEDVGRDEFASRRKPSLCF